MHNTDIEKLYEKVQVGTPVAITYSYKSFVNLASVYGYKFKGYKMKNYYLLCSILFFEQDVAFIYK